MYDDKMRMFFEYEIGTLYFVRYGKKTKPTKPTININHGYN